MYSTIGVEAHIESYQFVFATTDVIDIKVLLVSKSGIRLAGMHPPVFQWWKVLPFASRKSAYWHRTLSWNWCGGVRAVKGLKLPPEEQKAKADNVWNHLRTCPSFTEAMMARLNTGTKVLTAGGEEKVFQQTFERLTGEKLLHSYACYLSTSHRPVIGMLYSSDKRIVFCSDFSYCLCPGNPTLMHYKVDILVDIKFEFLSFSFV
ncbi:GLABRA2 expression modulator-like [Pyrus ussuriensis x Pyrus communis]|uniref:GLABRA2 expression modulator-like n=1 Tax=Pyrus ussuriensis x Pyrus communis TaxID=2448454 RepID=A0A5N5GP08_9ROSA|nr:GLABRA2 expression modulator-like [Pyrus ussuriensis x Pyrus communis]